MTDLTDLQITKLCAEAIELKEAGVDWYQNGEGVLYVLESKTSMYIFNPLHDDAQAMALVKKFRHHIADDGENWQVAMRANQVVWESSISSDLNRAICECVAKMQAAK